MTLRTRKMARREVSLVTLVTLTISGYVVAFNDKVYRGDLVEIGLGVSIVRNDSEGEIFIV